MATRAQHSLSPYRYGRRAALWDLDPDSYTDSTEAMVRYVGDHIRPGSLILLHAMNRSPSLDALEPLIVQLARQGYRFVTIDELLRAGPPSGTKLQDVRSDGFREEWVR